MNALTLIDRYFDGQIDRRQEEELGRLIAGDKGVAEAFVSASRVQACLEQHFGDAVARRQVRAEIATRLADRARRDRHQARRSERREKFARWRRPAIAAAAMITALAAAAKFAQQRSTDRDRAIAANPPNLIIPAPSTTAAPATSADSTPRPRLLKRDVKRTLRTFYLPGLAIAPMPIEDALAMVALSLRDIASRHGDTRTAAIELRLDPNLATGDPKRERLVTLSCNSVSVADALQLLAGQAGMNIALLDDTAELRPRLEVEPSLRTRSFSVLDDFFDRAAELVNASALPSNPLSMLAYEPPAAASASLRSFGDGTSDLRVQATPDDLRSINALISMLQENGERHIKVTSKLVDVSPEAVDRLAALASATDNYHVGGLMAAIANAEPADQIIADPSHFQRLVREFNDLKGVDILTLPTRITAPDVELVSDTANQRLHTYVFPTAHSGSDDTPPPTGLTLTIPPDVIEFDGFINYGTAINTEQPIIVASDFLDGAHVALGQPANIEVVRELFDADGDPIAPAHYANASIELGELLTDDALTIRTKFVEVQQENFDEHELVFTDSTRESVVNELNLAWQLHAAPGDEVIVGQTIASAQPSNVDLDSPRNTATPTPPVPGYRSTVVASLEGEAVRVSGSMNLSNRKPARAREIRKEMADTGLPFDYWELPSQDASEEIDFDATIAPGQTLMLEVDREDGGKQLVFMTAE